MLTRALTNTFQVESCDVHNVDWNKQTIKCIYDNKRTIDAIIRSGLSRRRKYYIGNDEAKDLFSEFVEYMVNKPDASKVELNIVKDDMEEDGDNVWMYVRNCLHTYIKKYLSTRAKEAKNIASNYVRTEGKGDDEYVEMDIPSDINVEKEVQRRNLLEQLKNLESRRSSYGFDIFMYVYLMILGTRAGLNENVLFDILSVCCRKPVKDLRNQRDKMHLDSGLVDAIESLMQVDDSTRIKAISQFLYGKKQIDSMVCAYL